MRTNTIILFDAKKPNHSHGRTPIGIIPLVETHDSECRVTSTAPYLPDRNPVTVLIYGVRIALFTCMDHMTPPFEVVTVGHVSGVPIGFTYDPIINHQKIGKVQLPLECEVTIWRYHNGIRLQIFSENVQFDRRHVIGGI
jgi:hypothetical protein